MSLYFCMYQIPGGYVNENSIYFTYYGKNLFSQISAEISKYVLHANVNLRI